MNKLLPLLFVTFLFSCSSKENKKSTGDSMLESYNISINEDNSNLNESVDFVILDDSCENGLFASISKLIVKNELIYILDEVTSSIYVFNMDGKFVKKIKHIGRGPGEYIRIRDFNVDNNCLYIYDDRTRKLLCYDLQGDKILHEYSTSFFARAFYILTNGDFLYILPKDQNHKQIVVTDTTGNLKNEFLDFEKDDLDIHTRHSLLQETSLGIVYSKPESNSFYLLSKENGDILKQYNIIFDNKKDNRDNKERKVLSSTPLLLTNIIVGNFRCDKSVFYYEIVGNSKDSRMSVKEIKKGSINIDGLLFPVFSMNDSIVVSYISAEVYQMMDNQNQNILSDSIKEHLDNGGYALCLYHLKR